MKLRNLILFIILVVNFSLLGPVNIKVSAASVLPSAENNVITLTEDVTLTNKFVVPAETNLTIDLAGHTIKGPSNNYAIENNGTLLITSSVDGGKITGIATSASCIQNTGVLKAQNITITSKFNGIKNDEGGVLNVDNCNISSSYTSKFANLIGAILNWGEATINDSTISATNKATAVLAMGGYEAGANTDSKIVLNNCTMKSAYSSHTIYSNRYNSTSPAIITIQVNGGSIKGVSGKAIHNDANGGVLTISGKVEAAIETLEYMEKGSTLVLNTALKSGLSRTIPEGITLDLSKKYYKLSKAGRLIVNGDLIGEVTDSNVYNVNQKAYYRMLSNAVAKVESEDEPETIILNNDNSDDTEINIPEGKNVTIDLNGKKLTATINNSKGSILTINDNSEEKSGVFEGNIVNLENGSILIEAGTFAAANTITNKGSLRIKGGNFGVLPINEGNGITTLEGGTYTIQNMNVTEDSGINISAEKELVLKEDGTYTLAYKPGDYTKVEEAIKQAQSLSKEDYKDFTALENAINSVVYEKNITEQTIIDSYAQAITDAINALEKVEKEEVKPEEPAPSVGEEDKVDPPKTGDNIVFWAGLAIISIACALGIVKVIINRVKHSKRYRRI